ILEDPHGAGLRLARGDLAQHALLERHLLLVVARWQAPSLGQDPDLEQVHGLHRGGVELAMLDARAGPHALPPAGPDPRAGTEAVAVLEPAVEHPGEDLHVAMRMGPEAASGLPHVAVDDPQRAEAHVARAQ